ncbi:MAG: MFS transporter [Merismopedia sp. SIO2A8]|nr:MFS transporter [Symploca sp. SIO2B6]NET48818.1 MFS transporter [Merismopedia sp. SIO2A8]
MVQVFPDKKKWFAWLPQLRQEIWILSAGQLLLFIGQGFTMVYASIFFVNELGFSPTQVGLALGSSGLSGLLGRFGSGYAIDSPALGRRTTLLISTIVAAIACCFLAFATTFPLLVTGNVLLGLGVGLYWPATMAVTTDLTTEENRTEAFALTRLADHLGIGLGALFAGQYIALSGSYRILFLAKGGAYLICGLVVYWTIAETLHSAIASPNLDTEAESIKPNQVTLNQATITSAPHHTPLSMALKNWWEALSDRPFTFYLLSNIFFTTYAAQLSSTLPLYLADFIPAGNTGTGFSEQWISYFFFWHALLKIVFQLPMARRFKPIPYATILLISLSLWLSGFVLIWLTGLLSTYALLPIVGAFSLIAFGEILYGPAAMTLIGEIAPVLRRGTYFSLDSQCWAMGYLIGPALGGWALDHPTLLGTNLWLALVAVGAIAGTLLMFLKRQMVAA